MYFERVLSFKSTCFEDSTMFKTILHISKKKSIFAALIYYSIIGTVFFIRFVEKLNTILKADLVVNKTAFRAHLCSF